MALVKPKLKTKSPASTTCDATIPVDWDAGLREKILASVSDPESGVVQFPARDNPHRRLRRASLTTSHYDLVPQPKVNISGGGYRIVGAKKRNPILSPAGTYATTLSAAILFGACIGWLAINPDVQSRTVEISTVATAMWTDHAGPGPDLMSTLPVTAFVPPHAEVGAFPRSAIVAVNDVATGTTVTQ